METFGLVLAELPGGSEMVMDPVHRHRRSRSRFVRSGVSVTLSSCSRPSPIPTALRGVRPRGAALRLGGAEALAWAARVALVTLVVALALEAAADGAAR